MIIAGWVTAAFAMIRGWRLIVKYRRCTSCRRVNYTRLNSNDICMYCGIDLPLDGPD